MTTHTATGWTAERPTAADECVRVVPAKSEPMLSETELDQIVGAGGKAGAGSNPVED
jgi:hypothetical protein